MVEIDFPLVFLFNSELQDSKFFLGDKKPMSCILPYIPLVRLVFPTTPVSSSTTGLSPISKRAWKSLPHCEANNEASLLLALQGLPILLIFMA